MTRHRLSPIATAARTAIDCPPARQIAAGAAQGPAEAHGHRPAPDRPATAPPAPSPADPWSSVADALAGKACRLAEWHGPRRVIAQPLQCPEEADAHAWAYEVRRGIRPPGLAHRPTARDLAAAAREACPKPPAAHGPRSQKSKSSGKLDARAWHSFDPANGARRREAGAWKDAPLQMSAPLDWGTPT